MALALPPARRLAAALAVLIGTLGPSARCVEAQAVTDRDPAPAARQQPDIPPAPDAGLSLECKVPEPLLLTPAPLKNLRAALGEQRPVKALLLGSPGSSAAAADYPARFEAELERRLGPGVDVQVEQRTLPGEITAEAEERITRLVSESEPDLVVWLVGGQDALAKADLADFARALDGVLTWLSEHEVDALLVGPPFSPAMGEDEHYGSLVSAVRAAAKRSGVPLVQRFEALRFLAQRGARGRTVGLSAFGLDALGTRCMAEHIALTVERSLHLTPFDSNSQDAQTDLPRRDRSSTRP